MTDTPTPPQTPPGAPEGASQPRGGAGRPPGPSQALSGAVEGSGGHDTPATPPEWLRTVDEMVATVEQHQRELAAAHSLIRTQEAAFDRVRRLALTLDVAGNEFIAEQIRAAIRPGGHDGPTASEAEPVIDQPDKPRHPDGREYSYAEIVAGSWGFCAGCRMWSNGTVERPHRCAMSHMRGPVAHDGPSVAECAADDKQHWGERDWEGE